MSSPRKKYSKEFIEKMGHWETAFEQKPENNSVEEKRKELGALMHSYIVCLQEDEKHKKQIQRRQERREEHLKIKKRQELLEMKKPYNMFEEERARQQTNVPQVANDHHEKQTVDESEQSCVIS